MNVALWMAGLGRLSLQGGVLVLLVLAVQWLFRRHLTPRWRCALWFLVMARLLLPVSPGSAASIFNFLPPGHRAPPGAEAAPRPPASAGRAASSLVAPPHAAVAAAGAAFPAPLPDEPASAAAPAPVAPVPAVRPEIGPVVGGPRLEASTAPALDGWRLLFWGWLAGACALAAYVLASSLRLAWRCRRLALCTDPGVLALRDQCAASLGIRRRPDILEVPAGASPALFGLFRPRLLLPRDVAAHFSAQELRYVFLHELAHLQRRDLAMHWIVTVLQIVHWFNPLLWLGFARWRTDRELACDALALEAAGGDHSRAYGRTILHLLEHVTRRATAPGLVGILEDKRQLHRRICMIASFRPGRRWGGPALVLMGALAWVGLTDAEPVQPAGVAAAADPAPAPEVQGKEAVIYRGADPQPGTTATNLEFRALTVTVLDPDGRPLAGAEVLAPYVGRGDERRPQRLTDGAGRYVLRFPIPPAEHRRAMSNFGISATHASFTHRALMWTSSGGDVYAGLPLAATLKLGHGRSIGGVVQDESGAPLSGVRVLLSGSSYRGFSMGNDERLTHEYSQVSAEDPGARGLVTDAAGRWQFDRFPGDMDRVGVTFVRPDGAREAFSTVSDEGLNRRPTLALGELLAGTAVARLPEGITVRGLVVDEAGKPLADVTVAEGYGHGNMVMVGTFNNQADGTFARPHRAPRQWIYTASRSDRATASVVAQVEPGMPPVRIVLPTAQPWTARVTDEKDRPLADVEFRIDSYRTEAQILDWVGRTDRDGRVVWTNAPRETVTAYAHAPALGVTRKVALAGGQPERTIVLRREAAERIALQVRAVDAETRAPVPVRSVSARYGGGGSPYRPLARRGSADFTAEIRRTDFRVGMYPSYELKVEADGYEPATTEHIDFDSGDQALELALRRTSGANGLVVRLPDGQPAAEARLWVRTAAGDGSVFINAPGRYYGDRMAKAQTDAEGRVELPAAAPEAPVVIAHARGFLESTVGDLRRRGRVQLAAYGEVEGRLLVAGQPRAGVNVSLSTLSWSPSLGYHLSYTATSGADGRFAFTQVPPGEFKLYRWGLPKRRDTSGLSITETYQQPVAVAAGQTNRIDYYTPGRLVVGQAIPAPEDAVVDWQHDIHTLTLKLPANAGGGRVNYEDFATHEAFQKAQRAGYGSAGQRENARRARTYPLAIEPDGSFRLEDVPPGAYELRVRLTRPAPGARRSSFGTEEELGSLVREVVVPAGDGPFELGVLRVPVRDAGPRQAAPRLSFTGTSLEGQPVSLAEFQGRHVLLVFWASWSDRSREFLAALPTLLGPYAADARLVLLGASLDDQPDAAREATKAAGVAWTQCWLDAASRVQWSETFRVDTLPAVFLIDPAGRLAARDVEAGTLNAAIDRVLSRK